MTDEELRQIKMESAPGSNYWEWAAAEQQERQQVAQNRKAAEASPREAVTLLSASEHQMKIFWSWQSDTPGKTGRFLVRNALRDAIEELKQAPDIEEPAREALHLDHDIQDVTGCPDLARTIFGKIEVSEVVIADVTLVGQVLSNTSAEKKLINSNVAIELGYALRACTDLRVLLVFNEHYGTHEELPFDLRHKGGAIVFNLPPDAEKEEIFAQKKNLRDRFVNALRPLLDRKRSQPVKPLDETLPTFNKAAYFGRGEILLQPEASYQGACQFLCYLRLIPNGGRTTLIELAALKDLVREAPLLSDSAYTGVLHGLNRFGAIICTSTESNLTASTQLFQNGEVWCISASLIKTEGDGVPQHVRLPYLSAFVLEKTYYATLRRIIKFATTKLGLKPPWEVELGLAGVNGLYFLWEDNPFSNPVGPVHKTEITHRFPVGNGNAQTLDDLLLSFFTKVFDSVGERRPPNLYGFPPNHPTLANR
jgi:hypothetical protein